MTEYIIGRTDKTLDFSLRVPPPFDKRLRFVLKECGVTTYKLYKNTKIKGLHIHKWEKGSQPRLSSLLEIANYLNVTLDYLVGRE